VPLRSPPGPEPTVVIAGPIACADVPGLCERVLALLRSSGADEIVCDVRALGRPDAGTVNALARLQLTARRAGARIRLRHASRELQELLIFVGLDAAVPVGVRLRVEPIREAEEREEPLGVEERVEPGDPAV
jgi:ABC-type transporter Mla MlaB component